MSHYQIKRFIAHFIDITSSEPNLTNALFDLNDKTIQKVVEFLTEHMDKALTATQLKTCKFQNDQAQIYNYCKEIVETPEDNNLFVEKTQLMTRKLQNVMRSTSSKSSGTLIFIEYHDLRTNSDYIAILKMDPNEGIELDPEHLTFKFRQNMLPSVKEKLHKSAFIKLNNPFDENTNLFILDKQQKSDGISKFFLLSFLEAKEELNDGKMTELFSEIAIEVAQERHLDILPFSSKFDKRIKDGEVINVENLLEDVLIESEFGEEDRLEFIEVVKQRMKKKNEDAYFIFKAEDSKEKTAFITSEDKTIRFMFPSTLFRNVVFVNEYEEDGEWITKIEIKGEKLKTNINIK